MHMTRQPRHLVEGCVDCERPVYWSGHPGDVEQADFQEVHFPASEGLPRLSLIEKESWETLMGLSLCPRRGVLSLDCRKINLFPMSSSEGGSVLKQKKSSCWVSEKYFLSELFQEFKNNWPCLWQELCVRWHRDKGEEACASVNDNRLTGAKCICSTATSIDFVLCPQCPAPWRKTGWR